MILNFKFIKYANIRSLKNFAFVKFQYANLHLIFDHCNQNRQKSGYNLLSLVGKLHMLI